MSFLRFMPEEKNAVICSQAISHLCLLVIFVVFWGKIGLLFFLVIFAHLWLHGIIDIPSAWHHKHMPEGECKFFCHWL